MAKCPFCSEQIQDNAIKCRYCKEWLPVEEEQASKQDNISSHLNTSENTEEDPLFYIGDIRIFSSTIESDGNSYMIADIIHLNSDNYRQSATYNAAVPGITTGERSKLLITLKSNVVLAAKSRSVFGIGSKGFELFTTNVGSLYRMTYGQRYNYYVSDLNNLGYFEYDDTRFFLDGKVTTRKGTTINISDYSIHHGGQFIQLVPVPERGFSGKSRREPVGGRGYFQGNCESERWELPKDARSSVFADTSSFDGGLEQRW